MNRIAKLGGAALLVAVSAAVGAHFWKQDNSTIIGQAGGADSAAKKPTAGSAVPVTVERVAHQDVPIIVEGLGTSSR